MDKDLVIKNLVKRETDRQFEIQKKKNEMKLIHPEHEQYHYFTEAFQLKMKQINELLDTINQKQEQQQNFDQIWKELHQLQKFVADSSMFLRDYDIRICQKGLQDAEAKTRKMEESLLPKKKFGFKNKRAQNVQLKKDVVDAATTTKIGLKDSRLKETFFGFRDLADKTLKLDDLYKKDVSLQNLTNCVVKLEGVPSTLHMSNLRACVVLTGPVQTSVFAENCTDCKFVVACQQLRLHASQKCDVYLHVTSKAIIEDSNQIHVAEYNYTYAGLDEDYERSTLDRTVNNWAKIEDFNWLVADKHSPNWSVLQPKFLTTNWENVQL